MKCRATQRGWVIVESSDKMWSSEGRNAYPFQYSCSNKLMNSMKMSLLGQKVSYMLLEQKEITNSSRNKEADEPRQKQCSGWVCLVVKVKSNVVKNDTA